MIGDMGMEARRLHAGITSQLVEKKALAANTFLD